MNRRLLSVFCFALVIAGVASLLLYQLLSAQIRISARRPVFKAKLVVAAHDLQIGTLIKAADLRQASYEGPVPNGAVGVPKEIIGRGVIADIYKGEPFIEQRLAPKGAGAGLAATIPVGMRAVALRVNDVVGLAGFVLPGMRVDVVVSGGGSDSQGDMVTRTILQNIEVLSAGQHFQRKIDNKPEDVQVVNLLVDPDQAEILALASNETKIQLVLRNPLDTKQETTQAISMAKLFGVPSSPKPILMREAPKRVVETRTVARSDLKEPTIEVFNGSKRSEQVIGVPGGGN